jgi:putative nucleotidyltransferase with HDIG domain
LAVLLLVATAIALVALLLPLLAQFSTSAMANGQVAPQDVRAPYDLTYESQVLTDGLQDAAERAVPPIYTSPDTNIARRQLEQLRSTLAFITSVRADEHASPEQKLADLAAIEYIFLDQETAAGLLELSDSRWQTVQQEAIIVLEQVMRGTIREDRLEETRRSIPNFVSLSLPEEQTKIVTELVSAFVVPNSVYSEELTETARQKARESVKPVTSSYKTGETIVFRGQLLTEPILEALQEYGLIQPQADWRDLASAAAMVILCLVLMLLYLRRTPTLTQDIRGLTLIAILFIVFLVTARLIVPDDGAIGYIFPLAAYSLTVAVLFGVEPAVITTILLAILVGYGRSNALELTTFFLISSLFGVFALGLAHRLTAFFRAAAAIASSGALIVVIYTLPVVTTDWIMLAQVAGAAFLNGVASASLAVLLQFFLAQFLGMTTALQLMDISRPDHPLLQTVLRTAPGTYQHSLQVANLSEQAAERIDADTLLTRVGALYHDIGKTLNPMFFIENQVPGSLNPHDNLDPLESARIIIRHVTDGEELARKHRLPTRIQDFIREHHGRTSTRYQYVKAVELAGGDEAAVDIEDFQYPGPRPGSRETAILMLADSCEARVRAGQPKDEAELHDMIRTVIRNRVNQGELDNTELTLNDIDTIADSFAATLRGIYHPRIEYPKLENKTPAVAGANRPIAAEAHHTAELNPSTQADHPSPTP